MDTTLRALVDKLDVPAFVRSEHENSLLRDIGEDQGKVLQPDNPRRLVRYGLILESGLVRSWRDGKPNEIRETARLMFQCWRSVANVRRPTKPLKNGDRADAHFGAQLLIEELGFDLVSGEQALSFRIAVTATISGHLAESRLLLNQFELAETVLNSNWRFRVAHDLVKAFVLLTRKKAGWTDIYAARESIERLRLAQKEFEAKYLAEVSEEDQRSAALELVGLYHLAQLLTLTSDYLIKGQAGLSKLQIQLGRHTERAISAFDAAGSSLLSNFAILLILGCEGHASNSVWTHVAAIAPLRRFVESVSDGTVTTPIIELWPAQQRALQSSFLDPYKTAISVQMPTSAGKTLLAKFAIIQAKALAPEGRCVYIVPTRALVNQVTFDLRRDFRPLKYQVEQAVPAMELDPTENALLSDPPDILVTTPEKLDLLIRDNHPCTRSLALVVVDEAHNLQDGKRGERLELLLGILKRDRPDVRFLLLSPFIPNANDLVEWLGGSRKLPPIQLDWRPSRRIVGVVMNVGGGSKKRLVLKTLAAADNVDVGPGRFVALGLPAEKQTVESITRAAVESLAIRGTVLVLCKGKGTANKRASQIATFRKERVLSELASAACAYVETEVGGPSPLSQLLKRGVAFHHAGLSHETRWLIERLICEKAVDVVCGTTTLAQGVNFPIASVLVETLQKGQTGTLSYSDFWNIAGRAGRALVDTVGVIGFPAPGKQQRDKYADFLKSEAVEIVSQLVDILNCADQLSEKMTLNSLRNHEHLSSFLRFLSHAARVAGKNNITDDVEDILRASLLYNQAQKLGHSSTKSLVRMCRNYISDLSNDEAGVLTLADNTGFATPSVKFLLATIGKDHKDFKRPETWNPDTLFGQDPGPLTERIQVISEVPEMTLGQGDSTQFNPSLVAKILRDWVNGAPLKSMADSYWMNERDDTPEKKLTGFCNYLFSTVIPNASWGLGALQGCSIDRKQLASDSATGFVPSMTFFGVAHKEAVWLRMAGAPRIIAEQLGTVWRDKMVHAPTSYQALRDWIGARSNLEWKAAIPAGSKLTVGDMRKLWGVFSGEPAKNDLSSIETATPVISKPIWPEPRES